MWMLTANPDLIAADIRAFANLKTEILQAELFVLVICPPNENWSLIDCFEVISSAVYLVQAIHFECATFKSAVVKIEHSLRQSLKNLFIYSVKLILNGNTNIELEMLPFAQPDLEGEQICKCHGFPTIFVSEDYVLCKMTFHRLLFKETKFIQKGPCRSRIFEALCFVSGKEFSIFVTAYLFHVRCLPFAWSCFNCISS